MSWVFLWFGVPWIYIIHIVFLCHFYYLIWIDGSLQCWIAAHFLVQILCCLVKVIVIFMFSACAILSLNTLIYLIGFCFPLMLITSCSEFYIYFCIQDSGKLKILYRQYFSPVSLLTNSYWTSTCQTLGLGTVRDRKMNKARSLTVKDSLHSNVSKSVAQQTVFQMWKPGYSKVDKIAKSLIISLVSRPATSPFILPSWLVSVITLTF